MASKSRNSALSNGVWILQISELLIVRAGISIKINGKWSLRPL